MAEIWDIFISETGSGGDITMNGNDIQTCSSIESAIYLAMFGGNIESDTIIPRIAGTQYFDYWGNTLFMGSTPAMQFNSLTERTLNITPLTSAGRPVIENAIKKDLSFLNNVTVTVQIVSTDKINVSLKIILPNGSAKISSFSLIKNPFSGDFDLIDFTFIDFF